MSLALSIPNISTESSDGAWSQVSPTFSEAGELNAWQRCFSELSTIRDLDNDWDDAGAPEIDRQIVETAYLFVNQLRNRDGGAAPTRIVATPMGTILFEWHTADGYVEVEIEEPLVVECMFKEEGRPAEHETIHLQETSVDSSISSVRSTSAVVHAQASDSEELYAVD